MSSSGCAPCRSSFTGSQGAHQPHCPFPGRHGPVLGLGAGMAARSSVSGCSYSPLDDAVVELEITRHRPHLLQELLHPAADTSSPLPRAQPPGEPRRRAGGRPHGSPSGDCRAVPNPLPTDSPKSHLLARLAQMEG